VLTVIDGAHAAGMLPLHVDAVGADFYAGNCHKWLLAPTGSGFLVLHTSAVDRLQPLQVSWGWHHDRRRPDERDEFGSTPRTRALEFEGTRDICPWLAVPAAIDFQAALGWERVRGRIAELAGYVRRRLDWLPPVIPLAPGRTGALTAFRVPAGTDPARLRAALWAERIEMPVIERPEGLLVRVSTHFYNTESEIDRLAEILPGALESAGGSPLQSV
jgi:isopenicillin-N epimerase